VEWLKSELSRYSPETTSEVTAMVRASHNLSGGVPRIEEIYEKTLCDHASNKKEDPREFARYLEKISMEVDAMWEQTNNIKKVKNKLREVTKRLEESKQTNAMLVKSNRNRVKRLEAKLRVAKHELRSVRSSRLWPLSKVMGTLGSFFRHPPAAPESGPGFTVGERGRDPLN
jgi:chromosome segregation ATPase